jgi:hypothetical protein
LWLFLSLRVLLFIMFPGTGASCIAFCNRSERHIGSICSGRQCVWRGGGEKAINRVNLTMMPCVEGVADGKH